MQTVDEKRAVRALAWPGGLIVTGFVVLGAISPLFGYAYAVVDMPILPMVTLLMALGAAFLVAAWAIFRCDAAALSSDCRGNLLILIVLVGAVARGALFFSEPILEDDYQRYLWDGAVTAAGYNPYGVQPADAADSEDARLRALAATAGLTLERVNHPEIRTIYPPGAQAFFAMAHLLKPFSLAAWRSVVVLADVATLALVLLLLKAAGRSFLWSALYWWNPIVIKELTNSVHMEAVLIPFILLAVWCAVRQRPLMASVAVSIAGAIKIWPLALFPLLMRASSDRLAVWIGCAACVGAITTLWATPMVLAGLDQSAGVVAYAEKWRTNSAGFATLFQLAKLSGLPTLLEISANHLARGAIALAVVASGLLVAVRRPQGAEAIVKRCGVLAIIIFLVSPAQFPWYVLWIAPFLAFLPMPGLLLLSLTMPLYYVAFHLMGIEAFPLFNSIVIWCIWLPVWASLIIQLVLQGPARRGREAAALTRHGRL